MATILTRVNHALQLDCIQHTLTLIHTHSLAHKLTINCVVSVSTESNQKGNKKKHLKRPRLMGWHTQTLTHSHTYTHSWVRLCGLSACLGLSSILLEDLNWVTDVSSSTNNIRNYKRRRNKQQLINTHSHTLIQALTRTLILGDPVKVVGSSGSAVSKRLATRNWALSSLAFASAFAAPN